MDKQENQFTSLLMGKSTMLVYQAHGLVAYTIRVTRWLIKRGKTLHKILNLHPMAKKCSPN